MNIAITGKNLEVTPAIRAYIEEKVNSVGKYGAEISFVDVEIDKNRHHKKGEVFHVRMNAQMVHELLRAETMETTLYAAVDVCRDQLVSQIENYSAKKDNHKRRAAKTRRDWKSILAFWK